MRTKKRKQLQCPRLPMEVPSAQNQRWPMDFVSDQISDGHRLRMLNVMDDFTKEIVGQLAGDKVNLFYLNSCNAIE